MRVMVQPDGLQLSLKRELLGLKIKDVEKTSTLSRRTIWLIEKNVPVSFESAQKLSTVYNINWIDYFTLIK